MAHPRPTALRGAWARLPPPHKGPSGRGHTQTAGACGATGPGQPGGSAPPPSPAGPWPRPRPGAAWVGPPARCGVLEVPASGRAPYRSEARARMRLGGAFTHTGRQTSGGGSGKGAPARAQRWGLCASCWAPEGSPGGDRRLGRPSRCRRPPWRRARSRGRQRADTPWRGPSRPPPGLPLAPRPPRAWSARRPRA
jgi:hypothetical protein